MNPQPNGKKKLQPAHRVRLGDVEAAAWANTGADGVWYSVTLVRHYKDARRIDRVDTAYRVGDLLAAAEVLRLLFLWTQMALGRAAGLPGQEPAPRDTGDPV